MDNTKCKTAHMITYSILSNSQMDIKFGRSVKSPQLPWKTGTQDSQSNINNKNNSKPSQKTTKIKSNSY